MRKGLIVLLSVAMALMFTVPAAATDIKASGFYHGFGIVSSFLDSGGGPSLRNSDEKQTNAYLQQRFRVKWTFGTENVHAVWYLESDMQWGDSSGSTPSAATRNQGGALGADKVQTETKNIYVWFKIPNTSIQTTFGLQGIGDSYSGVFASKGGSDMSAIEVTGKLEPVSYRFVFGKLYEGVPEHSDDVTLWMAEGKMSPMKNLKVGLNFYFLQDDSGKYDTARLDPFNRGTNLGSGNSIINGYTLKLYMPGIDAAFNAGPLTVKGWFFYQTGTFKSVIGDPDVDVSAFAANLRADANVGPGKGHLDFLYLSGGDMSDNKYKAPITLGDYEGDGYNTGPGGYSGYTAPHMTILLPDWLMATVSQCLIGCSGAEVSQSPGNQGRGIWFAGGGYAMNVVKPVKAEVNLGYLAATKLWEGDARAGKSMGTEINGTLYYSPYKGLTISGTAAYAWLGDFIKKGDAGTDNFENPWNTFLRVAYSY